MLGSHNSMSYLPPQNLWGKITRPWNKCQGKNLEEQYHSGVRYFDIRLRWIDGDWHLVHNRVNYGVVFFTDLAKKFNKVCCDKTYLRIILDERKQPAYSEMLTDRFLAFIKCFMKCLLNNIFIDSVITYWNWKEYKKPTIEVKEYHSSVIARWYQYLLGCKWFAKHYNKYAKEQHYDYVEDSERVLLLDYV